MFLLDPVTYDVVHLLPWMIRHKRRKVETLVFPNSEGKIFVIFGSGRSLAFCSTHRLGDGWALFGGALDKYESMVYSTAHRRLFYITSAHKLEAWDVGRDSPRLNWVAHFDRPEPDQPSPTRLDVKYLACEEHSGQLFLVVSHVRKAEEDLGVDFKVYKIDRGLNLIWDSLGGMAFFVGNNQAIAMRDVGVGVKPDSVYFTYDRRLRPYNSAVGYFDYRQRSFSRVSCPVVDNPYHLWFMAHPHHIIVG